MNRSQWKNLWLPINSFKKLKKNYKCTKKALKKNRSKSLLGVKISRSATIIPLHINSTFHVYSGKTFKNVLVVPEMIGHKFGEFCPTRVKFEFKKKKKKKKK